MAKKFHERRSLAKSLLTYLQGRGWNLTGILEGFQSQETVIAPTVSVYFLPSAFEELEIGRTKATFTRRVQIDAYMENEDRADAIGDDIMEFMDEVPIVVEDANTQEDLANMICYDTSSISSDTLPPILKEPRVKHWRNVSRATYETHYFD
jgi:hypothetical protein